MHNRWILILLLSTLAWGQATAPDSPKAPTKQAPAAATPAPMAPRADAKAAEVPPDTPVITLNGVCAKQPSSGGQCKTVVTRDEFDKLLEALKPPDNPQPLSPQARRQLATRYSQLLTAATEAEREGLQNTPEQQELLHFARLQALAQGLSRQMQKQAQPTPEEIQKYYQENAEKFQQITLQRLLIPASSTDDSAGDGKTKKDEMKTFAEELHKRAVAGEDFDKLQKNVYDKIGMQNPPSTTVVVQPENLTGDEEAVLKLKPGEVSQVFAQPTVFVVYKFVARKPIPLEQAKSDIQNTLHQQKLQAHVEKLLSNATPILNEAYFGPVPAPQGPHGPGGPAPKLPEGPRPQSPKANPPRPPVPGEAPQSPPK